MAGELPPQVQNQIQQFQQLQQQAAVIMNQRQQLEATVRELGRTVEALDKSDADAPIYRSVGSLLIRAKDRDGLLTDLKDQRETAEVRLESMKRQEARLRERLESLQKELEAALSNR